MDFGDFENEADSDKLARLTQLGRQLRDAEVEVERRAEALKKASDRVRDISEKEIPTLMEELKLTRFDLEGGFTLELKEDVFASISEAREAAAFGWLEEHGHAGIIKNQVVIAFNRGEQEKLEAFLADLKAREQSVDHKVNKDVASATLKKFARERLAEERQAIVEGEEIPDFPRELFGVFIRKVAKAKAKK